MYLHCKKCLTSRSGDILGEPCKTPGCDGIIEEVPAFSTLVDVVDEPFRCSRRDESPIADHAFPGLDHWDKFKTNGNRVCSYCGSLHWDDMLTLVKLSAEAAADADYHTVVEIEPSDKNYKVYVNQPGVRNAHEGGIKFYMQHVPLGEVGKIAVTAEQNQEYSEAVKRSRQRFERYLYGARNAV